MAMRQGSPCRENKLISEELARQLKTNKSLPSPPGVATRIIELANDPDVDIDRIAEVLSIDPATTARVLRIANSPMYAMSREITSLSQALMVLGLNATISLALSFSLLKSWQTETEPGGLDYSLFWRRAMLAAASTRAIAAKLGWRDGEAMFVAALIQDIGIMALDRTLPDLYDGLGVAQVKQCAVIERERERTGADHAEVGEWLLESWKFPETVLHAVRDSHDPMASPVEGREVLFVRAVAFSSEIAELFLEDSKERRFTDLAKKAKDWLGIDTEGVGELIQEVSKLIPDAESVFETRLLAKSEALSILDDAREALMLRNLMAQKEIESLQQATESLRKKTVSLEEASHRDALTGLYNRAYLDPYLQREFESAMEKNAPLSVAFADLDKFKAVNDTHGHTVGDQVLVAVANVLKANVRQADVVARYGGEEFILVFPDADYLLVNKICERITRAIESTRHDVNGESLPVTISMGLATLNDGRVFASVTEFVTAADKALYSAKLQGRNRSIAFDTIADAQVSAH
jgi:diguanylate cyclase (GGDEF)-like protein